MTQSVYVCFLTGSHYAALAGSASQSARFKGVHHQPHPTLLQELFQFRLLPLNLTWPTSWDYKIVPPCLFCLFLKWVLGSKWLSFLYGKHFTNSVVSTTFFLKVFLFFIFDTTCSSSWSGIHYVA